MNFVNNILKVILGDKSAKDLKPIQPLIKKSNSFNFQNLTNDELRDKTKQFRLQLKEATQSQSDQITELKTLIDQEKDVYKKDEYYSKIDSLSKESYKRRPCWCY